MDIRLWSLVSIVLVVIDTVGISKTGLRRWQHSGHALDAIAASAMGTGFRERGPPIHQRAQVDRRRWK